VFVHFGHVIFRIIISAVFSLKIISARTEKIENLESLIAELLLRAFFYIHRAFSFFTLWSTAHH